MIDTMFHSLVLYVLGHINTAADAMWEDVLSSIGNLLMEIEIQNNNPELDFHKATLLLKRLEMALFVLRSLLDMDLGSDDKANQVLDLNKNLSY